jgi:hypothetical protein
MTDETSIDDLLGHDEESPAAQRRPPSAVAGVIKTIVYAAVLGALCVLALRPFTVTVPYVLAFTVMLALLVLRRLVRRVAAPPPARAARVRLGSARDDDVSFRWDNVDGLRAAVGRWESTLDWGRDTPERFTTLVHSRIAEIVDERLRQKHGVSRTGDPVRARALLGEPLWTFLTTPVSKPPTPRELAAVVGRMEAL